MIEIEGPDGVIYEFPAGTDDATIKQAMPLIAGFGDHIITTPVGGYGI